MLKAPSRADIVFLGKNRHSLKERQIADYWEHSPLCSITQERLIEILHRGYESRYDLRIECEFALPLYTELRCFYRHPNRVDAAGQAFLYLEQSPKVQPKLYNVAKHSPAEDRMGAVAWRNMAELCKELGYTRMDFTARTTEEGDLEINNGIQVWPKMGGMLRTKRGGDQFWSQLAREWKTMRPDFVSEPRAEDVVKALDDLLQSPPHHPYALVALIEIIQSPKWKNTLPAELVHTLTHFFDGKEFEGTFHLQDEMSLRLLRSYLLDTKRGRALDTDL